MIIFLLDWWLIRNRQNSEKKNAALTVGEVVNSIISLDKREFPNKDGVSSGSEDCVIEDVLDDSFM